MIVPPSQAVLHQSSTKAWFKSRHASKVKMEYQKTQKEIFDDQVVIRTFHMIDKDQSNTLDIEEIYTMFMKNGYPININLLKKFFDLADKDHNSMLNSCILLETIELDEFRHIVYDEQASQCFRVMMRKMRESGNENYYSTDFVKLLRYLCYCQSRSDLSFQISNRRLPVEKRSKLVTNLIKLNEKFTDLDNPRIEKKIPAENRKKLERKYLSPMPKQYLINSWASTNTHLNTSSSQNSIQIQSFMNINSQSPIKTDRKKQYKSDSYLLYPKHKLY